MIASDSPKSQQPQTIDGDISQNQQDKAIDPASVAAWLALASLVVATVTLVRDEMRHRWDNDVFRNFDRSEKGQVRQHQNRIDDLSQEIEDLTEELKNAPAQDQNILMQKIGVKSLQLADEYDDLATHIEATAAGLGAGANFDELNTQVSSLRRNAESVRQEVNEQFSKSNLENSVSAPSSEQIFVEAINDGVSVTEALDLARITSPDERERFALAALELNPNLIEREELESTSPTVDFEQVA